MIIVFGTKWLTVAEPSYVIAIENLILSLKKLPGQIITLALEAIPALIGAIVYKKKGQNEKLQGIEIGYLVVLIVAVVVSGFNVVFFDLDKHADNLSVGSEKELISIIISQNSELLKLSTVYLISLIGFNYNIESLFKTSTNG